MRLPSFLDPIRDNAPPSTSSAGSWCDHDDRGAALRGRLAGHPLHDRSHANGLWIAASAVHIDAPLLTADRIFDNTPELPSTSRWTLGRRKVSQNVRRQRRTTCP
jgi:hypothetical protein